MKYIWTIFLSLILFSCNNADQINKPPLTISPNEYGQKYPLVKFYFDDKKITRDKRESYFPEGVTDLIVDTTGGRLIISFDREGEIGCPLIGDIDTKHVHLVALPEEKNVKDTLYLDYYLNCQNVDNPVTESIELRLYYEITDALSYKRAMFIPRQKKLE